MCMCVCEREREMVGRERDEGRKGGEGVDREEGRKRKQESILHKS